MSKESREIQGGDSSEPQSFEENQLSPLSRPETSVDAPVQDEDFDADSSGLEADGNSAENLIFPSFKDIPGISTEAVEAYEDEIASLEQVAVDDVPVPDFSVKAMYGEGFSNQMENVAYADSIREYVGRVVPQETLQSVISQIAELPDEEKMELMSFANDTSAVSAMAIEGNSQAKISAITTEAVMEEGETSAVGSAEDESTLSFWNKPQHKKLQKVLAAVLTTIVGAVAVEPAFAGDRNRVDPVEQQIQYERNRVINDARAVGINILFGVVQRALENNGYDTNASSPVPIPGSREPVYGRDLPQSGVYGGQMPYLGGYENHGGGMSDQRIKLEQRVVKDQERVQTLRIQVQEYYNKAQQTREASMANPYDTKLAKQSARDYAQFRTTQLNLQKAINQLHEDVARARSTR